MSAMDIRRCLARKCHCATGEELRKVVGSSGCVSDHSPVVVRSEVWVALLNDPSSVPFRTATRTSREGCTIHSVPAHLLLLAHATGDDLVDRALEEGGRDRLVFRDVRRA